MLAQTHPIDGVWWVGDNDVIVVLCRFTTRHLTWFLPSAGSCLPFEFFIDFPMITKVWMKEKKCLFFGKGKHVSDKRSIWATNVSRMWSEYNASIVFVIWREWDQPKWRLRLRREFFGLLVSLSVLRCSVLLSGADVTLPYRYRKLANVCHQR